MKSLFFIYHYFFCLILFVLTHDQIVIGIPSKV